MSWSKVNEPFNNPIDGGIIKLCASFIIGVAITFFITAI